MTSLLRSGHRHILLRRLSGAAVAGDLIDVRKLPTNYDPATYDPSSPSLRPPPSDRVWRLVDEVASLTVAESASLTSILLRRLGADAPPPIAILNSGSAGTSGASPAAGAAAAAGENTGSEEKTVFELRLESFETAAKIKVIKEVRALTDLGLKEAKDLVEKAPAVIKGGLSKEDAEHIIERMKAVGAKVVMA